MSHVFGGLTLPTPATSLEHKLLQRLLDVQQDLRAFETLDEVFEPELTDSIKVDVKPSEDCHAIFRNKAKEFSKGCKEMV